MVFLLFFTAIVLSGIAAYYSVIGLIAIFSAAALPVAIMGGSLEIAKLVVASWLYRYWQAIPLLMKTYFTSALVVLMLITSMGIFGFLSKAHNDQSLVSGDVLSKLAIYDEKIKTAKDNIDANRKALKQLDESVDQVMGRSTTETGADKAVALRRSQSKERARLTAEIAAEQKTISKLNEEAAPIRAEVRKVEAEVGPIKYIAALIYGDNPDGNLLERAVRWLIILLIFVFDPLAVLMLIAANLTQIKKKQWQDEKLKESDTVIIPTVPKEDSANDNSQYKIIPDEAVMPVASQATEQTQTQTSDGKIAGAESTPAQMEAVGVDTTPPGWMFDRPVEEPVTEELVKDIEKKIGIIHKLHQEEDKQEPKKKVRKSRKKVELDTVSLDNNTDNTQQPIIEKITEDKSTSDGIIGKPIAVDEEVQKMIDSNDQQGLEQVYKKIVKELAKKNRAKSTHWGPIKNKNG